MKKKRVEINSDTHPLIRGKQQSAALLLSRGGCCCCCCWSHMRDFNSSSCNQVTFHSSHPPPHRTFQSCYGIKTKETKELNHFFIFTTDGNNSSSSSRPGRLPVTDCTNEVNPVNVIQRSQEGFMSALIICVGGGNQSSLLASHRLQNNIWELILFCL